jgi:hypothetical protein
VLSLVPDLRKKTCLTTMVARGRRGRGLIRPSLSSSQGNERVERTIRAVDKTTISGQPALEVIGENDRNHLIKELCNFELILEIMNRIVCKWPGLFVNIPDEYFLEYSIDLFH